MGSLLMNNNINKKIVEKIEEIPNTNVQNFLLDILEIEYEVRDQDKPRIKDRYEQKIEKYYSDSDDS